METSVQGDQKNKPIKLNLDEFDIEGYQFTPVTKGLGFHEKTRMESFASETRKPKPRQSLMTPSHQLVNKKMSQASHPRENTFLQSSPTAVPSEHLMGGLDAIYKKEQKIKNEPITTREEVVYVKADSGERVLAYFADILILSIVTGLQFYVFHLIAFGVTSGRDLIPFFEASWLYIVLFFTVVYLFYFSLMEPMGTIGQKFLGLSVVKKEGQAAVSLRKSALRAFVTLFSFVLLGLPSFLKFQDHLSDTKVIKK